MSGTTREVVWHSPLLHSLELFTMAGRTMRGLVALTVDGAAGHIVYTVETDTAWNTVSAAIDVRTAKGDRRLALIHGPAGWSLDGVVRPDLAECVDLDLGWTPATNLLPVRRLGLEVGAGRTIRAAWVRFPEFSVEVSEQTYTRLGDTLWRYQSGPYDFELSVDRDGLVLRYGADEDGLWRAMSSH